MFLLVSLACYFNFGASIAWISVCAFAGSYYILVIIVSLNNFLLPGPPRSLVRKMFNWCRRWYSTQVFGALLVALPIISLYANLTSDLLDVRDNSKRIFFMNLLVVTLIHFCNFTQIYCYVKSLLATLFAAGFLLYMVIIGPPDISHCHQHLNTTETSTGKINLG